MKAYNAIALSDILRTRTSLLPEQLDSAITESKKNKKSLIATIVQTELLSEEEILTVIAKECNIPFFPNLADLAQDNFDVSIIKSVPAKFATFYHFMPLRENNGVLTIAVHDPCDIQMLDELKLTLGKELNLVAAKKQEIENAIKKYYGIGADIVERMLANSDIEILTAQNKQEDNIEDETTDNASVIKFINQIIVNAIKDRATDIHIETYENELRIRYRIDGVLYEADIPPTIKHFHSALVSRLKVMASLNIAEKRLPQDGRIKIRMGGNDYDLRISILPTPLGETVNIRLLSQSSILFGLEQLGFSKEHLKKFSGLISKPHGIILVTGPTGSGKTTTLYASLSRINSVERKILTIEDPIEYRLRGITQMQIHPAIGFTFANALRSMLRHDPDVMMVGEIRDTETAEIAIRAALTGHLVFSTVHTNDAAGAVTRLMNMGIEPYLISSSVEGIIAQRLVRTICPHCREAFVPPQEVLDGIAAESFHTRKIVFYKGRGCEKCKHTGYWGRTGIFELLIFTDRIKELVMERTPANLIKQEALKLGMRTLRQDGLENVIHGRTTLEEVLKATTQEEEPI